MVQVPMPDVYDPTLVEDPTNDFSRTYGSGTFYVTSNADRNTYTIVFVATCTDSGSTYRIVSEKVNGINTMTSEINLRTTPPANSVTVTTSGNVFVFNYNNINITVDTVTRNGIQAGECTSVNSQLMYSDGQLSFNNRTISNITALYRIDKVRLATYTQYLSSHSTPPHTDTGPLYLCIDYNGRFTGYTKDNEFIDTIMSAYNNLVGSLKPPIIAPGTVSPPRVTESNQEFQIGTTSIEVLEEIHRISLRCRLSDVGNPSVTTYMWKKDGQTVVSDNVNYLITDDVLLIRNTDDPSDEGLYTCTVNNGFGTANASTFLNITQEFDITSPTTQPTTPSPAIPMWFAHPFTPVSKISGMCKQLCVFYSVTSNVT